MRWVWMLVVAMGCGVVPPDPQPVTCGQTVAVQVVRFDTGGLVSSGVPLAAGLLRDADSVRLVIDGAEVPMAVDPLIGRHADGSYKSVLVQFPWTKDAAQGVLEFGVAGRRIDAVPITWTLESAVLLPTDMAYVRSTGVLPPMVDQIPEIGGAYDSTYARWAAHFVIRDTLTPFQARRGVNYYDRVLNSYVQWARTGNVQYWRDAAKLARLYQGMGILYQHHEFQPDGIYLNYLLTGDSRSRTFLTYWATRRAPFMQPQRNYSYWFDKNTTQYLEGRIQARQMLAGLYAAMLDDSTRNWVAYTDALVKSWVDIQEPHFAGVRTPAPPSPGAWQYRLATDSTGRVLSWGQSNYMEGLRVTAMLRYLDLRQPPDSVRLAVEQSIKRQVDYLWPTQWVPQFQSFRYWSVDASSTQSLAELNALMSIGLAYTYHVTGDTTYRDRAWQTLRPAWANPNWRPWWQGHNGKIFNQNYYSSWQALYYLTVPPRL
jgi:hypothetical protein